MFANKTTTNKTFEDELKSLDMQNIFEGGLKSNNIIHI
jgi:hypothetical protein